MERLEGSVFPQAELVLEESQNLLERGGQLAASESSQELSQCLKAPWLPVEGTVLLSSLPCISCSSQAINNTYPQQPVISLWLLQQVTSFDSSNLFSLSQWLYESNDPCQWPRAIRSPISLRIGAQVSRKLLILKMDGQT